MLVSGLWFLPNIVNLVVFAHGVTVPRHEADAYSQAVFGRSLKTVIFGIPLALFGALAAETVVATVFGDEFREAARAFVWLLPGAYLMLFFKLLNGDLAARGRPDIATRVFSIAFVINLALNLWWIPPHGYIGAAAASTVSYALGAGMFLLSYRRITGVRLQS
jgi:O-antigen/teichoic acid export membrane protein